jgi:hypothetical protein
MTAGETVTEALGPRVPRDRTVGLWYRLRD